MNFLKKEMTRPVKEVLRILLAAFAVFTIFSIFSYNPNDVSWLISNVNMPIKNFTGTVGAYFVFILKMLIGNTIWILAALSIYWSIKIHHNETYMDFGKELLGAFFLIISCSGVLAIISADQNAFDAGGLIGYQLGKFFDTYFNKTGAFIIFTMIIFLSLTLATEFYILVYIFALFKYLGKLFAKLKPIILPVMPKSKPCRQAKRKVVIEEFPEEIPEEDFKENIKAASEAVTEAEQIIEKKGKEKEKEPVKSTIKLITPKLPKEERLHPKNFIPNNVYYQGNIGLPPIDLLALPVKSNSAKDDKANIAALSKILEQTLVNFDINAKVVAANSGPMITVFEVQPAPGVKINKITSLSNDIALAMKAKTVRIVAPIPGKAVVGVEVPNLKPEAVYMRSLIESKAFQESESKLTMALGKDVAGDPIITALDKMPHLLIAGSTGSGKTVCVNSLIVSILYKASPEDVKFLMIDPKMVEMTFYNDIPHMITPVVTDPKKAACALNWAVKEMEKRYELFAAVGVRNITGYNKRMKNASPGNLLEK